MKTCVCCIIKKENLYLRDWVEWYKKIGFTNIVLYDNNDINDEYPHQVIGDYISNGFVIYRDVRGKHRYQEKAYSECYAEFSEQFDWIGFFDCDEFLELTNDYSIEQYLSRKELKDSGCVILYWENYGDSGLVHYDNRPVYERFKVINEKHPPCYKLLVKTSSKIWDFKFSDANCYTYMYTYGEEDPMSSTYSDGSNINGNLYKTLNKNLAFLKHYQTLTIEEFLYRRFCRNGYADNHSNFNKDTIMGIFYLANEITEEKQKIIDDFFNKFEIKEDLIHE